MISRVQAEELLVVARRARDRLDYRIRAGKDRSETAARERDDLVRLVEECQDAMLAALRPQADIGLQPVGPAPAADFPGAVRTFARANGWPFPLK